MIGDLWNSGILDAADRVMVVAAAMHYGLAMDAREKIDKYGLIYPVTRGAKDGQPGHTVIEANPAVGILRESLTELRQCCDSLGIGPSSRARLAGLGVKSKAIEKEIPGLEQFHTIVTGQN
ncbi:MAG: hypothetical protein DDT38_01325 [Firmicutes bacterium]|nr:hypothetical protein [candidate division NPL-UPA2 bacterium]